MAAPRPPPNAAPSPAPSNVPTIALPTTVLPLSCGPTWPSAYCRQTASSCWKTSMGLFGAGITCTLGDIAHPALLPSSSTPAKPVSIFAKPFILCSFPLARRWRAEPGALLFIVPSLIGRNRLRAEPHRRRRGQEEGRENDRRCEAREYHEEPIEIPALAVNPADELHRERRHAEGEHELGAEGGRAPALRRVARQQQILRRLAAAVAEDHEQHGGDDGKPGETAHQIEERQLEREEDQIGGAQAEAVREPAAHDLEGARGEIDDGEERPRTEHAAREVLAKAQLEELRHHRLGRGEDQPAADDGDREHPKGTHRIAPAGGCVGQGLEIDLMVENPAAAAQKRQRRTGRDRRGTRNDESGAPADEAGEKVRDHARRGDAHAAEDAEDADRETGPQRRAHEPRHADGMVDRGKEPEGRECHREPEGRLAEPGADRG